MPTLTIAGTITFPLGAEATPPPGRPFSAQLLYTQRNIDDVTLVGAQTDVNLMGQIANAKACYVEVEQGIALLKANGAVPTIPVAATGGFWIWFNPAGGLTALTVSTTANAKLRIYMFT